MTREQIRLTSLATCAGCAAEVGPGILAEVLRPLIEKFHPEDHPRLLVGITDDAAVYQINDEIAIVQTLDFFPPVVDDPWTFGAVAAANAMSDVYAMGGEVVLALNIAAFPEDLPTGMIGDILRGGAEKVAEAGGIIAGGHTIIDDEPKYGLSVTGFVHPKRVLGKAGARVGDSLVLTKALGTGLILTAMKEDVAEQAHFDAAVASMLRLNRHGSHLALEAGAHAMTDVTGYAIAGHALEIAGASGVELVFSAAALPVLPGALGYAKAGVISGGLRRNLAQLSDRTRIADGISDEMEKLIFDPQTSGALLAAVPPENAASMVATLLDDGYAAAVVGEVRPGAGVVFER